MKLNGSMKPSKLVSALAVLVGVGMFILGLVELIPQGGWFGWFWLLVVVSIIGFHLVNLISSRGVAEVNIEFSSVDMEARLERLENLKNKGLITASDYDIQKKRILNEI